ncbi:amino acid permease [Rhodothermaceae bacterium RA]|nr:amino acid permease [Rhodothermaceae bacterium RA]
MSDADTSEKMGFNATWSMAVGGMVGGGIFSVLGVVIEVAAQWAWLSFIVAGGIALATGYSYSQLAEQFGESGGAFTFLREINREGFAGSLSWVLLFGYVLTISVYAYTFGHYLGYVLDFGPWFPRLCALGVIAFLAAVNLKGVGESASLEVIAVWGKLFVLVGLAAIGLWQWKPDMLTQGVEAKEWTQAFIGAASIFMAYEGFQLLTYDYDDIRDPKSTLPRATLAAIGAVIAVYVVVTLGASMLVGAEAIVQKQEVALSVAGQAALGTAGLWLVTVAAAFSTGSAINATLFATARLAEKVAQDGELPPVLDHENANGIPDRAVLSLSALGAALSIIGSLATLVEAASLAFLFTFAVVNGLAVQQQVDRRWIAGMGGVGAVACSGVLLWRLAHEAPLALGLLSLVVLVALLGRPRLLQWARSSDV